MSRKQFFFAERYFKLFDEDDSGTIELLELLGTLRKLRKATGDEKINFLFQVYDVDGEFINIHNWLTRCQHIMTVWGIILMCLRYGISVKHHNKVECMITTPFRSWYYPN